MYNIIQRFIKICLFISCLLLMLSIIMDLQISIYVGIVCILACCVGMLMVTDNIFYRICYDCNAFLPKSAKYCKYCGHKIEYVRKDEHDYRTICK